jgi:predicted ABC-type ATPase
VLLFLAGPNGSGKSSLFAEIDGLSPGRDFPFVNADLIARVLSGIPQADVLAQRIADVTREHMLKQKASFATETVFSDEVGAKLDFLRRAEEVGFHVVMIYVTLANVHLSRQRVAFRVKEHQGHDVPPDRLERRFIASRENCRRALYRVETGLVLDNSSADVDRALRLVAVVKKGQVAFRADKVPAYVQQLLPVPSEPDVAASIDKEAVRLSHSDSQFNNERGRQWARTS